MKKRIVSILTVLCMLPFGEACSAAPADSHSLEKRNVPVYCSQLSDFRDAAERILIPEYSLYYADGVKDLPYVDLSEFVELVNRVDSFDLYDLYGEQTEKQDYVCR